METNPPDDRPVDYSEILGQTVSGPVTSSPLRVDPITEKGEEVTLSSLFPDSPGVSPFYSALARLDDLTLSYESMLTLIEAKLGSVTGREDHTVGFEDIKSFFNWNSFSASDPEKGSELVLRLSDFIDRQHGILAKMIHLLSTVQVGDSLRLILESNQALLNGLRGGRE